MFSTITYTHVKDVSRFRCPIWYFHVFLFLLSIAGWIVHIGLETRHGVFAIEITTRSISLSRDWSDKITSGKNKQNKTKLQKHCVRSIYLWFLFRRSCVLSQTILVIRLSVGHAFLSVAHTHTQYQASMAYYICSHAQGTTHKSIYSCALHIA